MHEDYNIPVEATYIPTIDITATKDTKSGYNLEVKTTNFAFAPLKVNTADSYSEGHAHLMVNDKMVSRLYGNFFHLQDTLFQDGENTIAVSLNTNTHKELHYKDQAISKKITVQKLNPEGITMSDLNILITNDKNVTIIDVRTPSEYSEGHIPSSINVDVQNANFKTEIEKLDKSKQYVVYCRSGNRSLNAYNQMKAMGFVNIYNVKEGFSSWQNLQLPISK
jgi:rhodanese-related sulfurtransferase